MAGGEGIYQSTMAGGDEFKFQGQGQGAGGGGQGNKSVLGNTNTQKQKCVGKIPKGVFC